MNKFIDLAKPPNLNNKETNNLNRSLTKEEIDIAIKSPPTKTNPGQDRFRAETYQAFKETLQPISLKERKTEGACQYFFYEASITNTKAK